VARAHVDALDYLRRGGAAAVFSCGYGHGYSVREVLESVQRIAGSRLAVREEPQRPGDPPTLIARAERIGLQLGWTPQFDNQDAIVDSALRWERKLQREPW
jgi:UDP-glucose 4-epimerase